MTEPARALLDRLEPAGGRLAALIEYLQLDCPGLQPDLEALVLYGTGFRHHCPRGDGTAFEIVGEPRGGAAFLSIRPASEEARALRDTQAELARTMSEVRFLRDVLDRAPVLAWSDGPDGQVAWANAPYRERFDAPGAELPDHRIPNAFGHVIEEVPLTARGVDSRRRVAVPGREDAEPHWFEVSQVPARGGETLGFALGGRRPGRGGGGAPALRRDADRDLRAPADRARGLRQEPAARALQPGADRSREDRRGLARRAAELARLPGAAARDPADAGAEGLRLVAAQALRARGRARARAPTRRTGSCPRARSSG